MITPHKVKTSRLISDFFRLILCSVLFCVLSSVGQFSRRTVWRSPPSAVDLSRSSPLLYFGGSLHCERKRFCIRCLVIDVTLYAMHCFFSRIRCCGNMITEPFTSNGHWLCIHCCYFQASYHNILSANKIVSHVNDVIISNCINIYSKICIQDK
jgi:hypothetical protein